jgi:hypothetical protein
MFYLVITVLTLNHMPTNTYRVYDTRPACAAAMDAFNARQAAADAEAAKDDDDAARHLVARRGSRFPRTISAVCVPRSFVLRL